jgi:hypothetical protein
MDDLQKLYDCFAKGKTDNGWDGTPHLRLSLIGFNGSVACTIEEREEKGETSFPLARTENRKLFLDNASLALSSSVPSEGGVASYDGHSDSSEIRYSFTFDKYTELSGYPWACLYVSCKEHHDMDVNIMIRRRGINGNNLVWNNFPVPVIERELQNSNVAKYRGVNSMLHASHQVSAESKAHPDARPSHTHRHARKLVKGNVYKIKIPTFPIGMVFGAGEGIDSIVAEHDLKLHTVIQTNLVVQSLDYYSFPKDRIFSKSISP